MNIVAVQLGHNATVLLQRGSEVRNIVSQERFDNIKNSSAFPEAAVRWLLDRTASR